jgi:hypothetical protein
MHWASKKGMESDAETGRVPVSRSEDHGEDDLSLSFLKTLICFLRNRMCICV